MSSRLSRAVMTGVMKAVRVMEYGGPEKLKILTDVPIPQPSSSQLLVDVRAAGMNPVDTYIYSGTYAIKPDLPFTPGSDLSGVVQKVGADVTQFKPGDRIYATKSTSGSFAQFVLTEAAQTFSLHPNLDFDQGAALGIPYFTAYRAVVQRLHARGGQTLLVHGASGAVGIACCQMARTLGLTVYGTAGTEKGLEIIQQNGVHHAFNHRKDGYMDDIRKHTNGVGVNLVIEMLANVNLEKDLQIAAQHGQIAVIGSRGTIEITPRHTMAKELSVHGVMPRLATKEEAAECVAFIAAGQQQGWIKPVIGQSYSLDDVAKAAVEVIEHNSGTCGKIVLNIKH